MANPKFSNNQEEHREHINADPISGEPGSHPVGTGLGTLGGAFAGAAIASTFGPFGTLAGAAAGALFGSIVGGVVGAYTGRDIAEMINPTEVDIYWSENYADRPYVRANENYKTYEPAYRYGYNSRINNKYTNKKFDEVESDLSKDWYTSREDSPLSWDEAKYAVRDSYEYTDRLYRDKLKSKNNKTANNN